MKKIGLTGPSGTGKSRLSLVAKDMGYFVIDCDKVAATVREEPKTVAEVKKAFPAAVKNGTIDRKALALLAFESREATEKLNSVMLPLIVEKMDEIMASAEKEGYDYCLLDAPTLYESGADKNCAAVIAVLADEALRKERIKRRDGISGELLEKRLAAAKPDSFYIEKTGHIIYNNGDEAELLKAATEILEKLKEN